MCIRDSSKCFQKQFGVLPKEFAGYVYYLVLTKVLVLYIDICRVHILQIVEDVYKRQGMIMERGCMMRCWEDGMLWIR